MILFKEPAASMILRGEKTQARKMWRKPRAKEGSEHLACRRLPMRGERPFAKIKVDVVRRQRLADMTTEEVRAEGYSTLREYLIQYGEGRKVPEPLEELVVYVLEFHVIERYEPVPS